MLSLYKKECGSFKPFLISYVIVCIYWWRLRMESAEKEVFSAACFPLYSFGHHRNDLAGEGKVFSQPCISRYVWHFPASSLCWPYTCPLVYGRRKQGAEEWGKHGAVHFRTSTVHDLLPRLFFLLAWVLFHYIVLLFPTTLNRCLEFGVD